MKTELVFSRICPFAHRVWLGLEELGVPYESREASLTAKEAWFTEVYRSALGADVSSDGKVPVLVEKDETGSSPPFILAESGIILDYLANKGNTALLPPTPTERAHASIFVEQVIPQVIKTFYGVLMSKDEAEAAKQKTDLNAAYAALSKAYSRTPGPYFSGSQLTTADLLVWPWIERAGVLAHWRKATIPEGPEYAHLHAFIAAMKSRPSVQKTSSPDGFYIDGYKSYAGDKIIA